MAYVLAAYQEQENLTDEGLADALGTLPALVVRLRLCKRPPAFSPQFAEKVRELADYTLADAPRLANILRQVDALEKLPKQDAGLASPEGATADASHPTSGLLAAARDRVESPDDAVAPAETVEPED
jgi:hypothetical protein